MDVLMMTVLIGQLDDMGACRLYGSLNVNKVASNLHITSDGHGYASNQHTSHDCKWFRSAFRHDQLIWQCIVLNFTHRDFPVRHLCCPHHLRRSQKQCFTHKSIRRYWFTQAIQRGTHSSRHFLQIRHWAYFCADQRDSPTIVSTFPSEIVWYHWWICCHCGRHLQIDQFCTDRR